MALPRFHDPAGRFASCPLTAVYLNEKAYSCPIEFHSFTNRSPSPVLNTSSIGYKPILGLVVFRSFDRWTIIQARLGKRV